MWIVNLSAPTSDAKSKHSFILSITAILRIERYRIQIILRPIERDGHLCVAVPAGQKVTRRNAESSDLA